MKYELSAFTTNRDTTPEDDSFIIIGLQSKDDVVVISITPDELVAILEGTRHLSRI